MRHKSLKGGTDGRTRRIVEIGFKSKDRQDIDGLVPAGNMNEQSAPAKDGFRAIRDLIAGEPRFVPGPDFVFLVTKVVVFLKLPCWGVRSPRAAKPNEGSGSVIVGSVPSEKHRSIIAFRVPI